MKKIECPKKKKGKNIFPPIKSFFLNLLNKIPINKKKKKIDPFTIFFDNLKNNFNHKKNVNPPPTNFFEPPPKNLLGIKKNIHKVFFFSPWQW